MIEKLTQKLNQFYHFAFVFIMIATLGTIFYFWKLGFIDGSRNKELHKANYILEQIETQKPLKEIKNIVTTENPKLAISKVELLEKDLEKINKLIDDKDFSDVKIETQQLKTAIANLISYPKTVKVFNVFNSKLQKFNTYVGVKKWRTLTRTSNRILNLTKGHINRNKLGSIVKTIEKDFRHMVSITESSYLTGPEKSEVLSRISNLEIETNMIKKYVGEKTFFTGVINNFTTNMKAWITKISPDLSYQKLQIEQMGRYYIMGLFGILALVSTVFFSSFMFGKWHRKNAQGDLEKFVENFVTSGLIDNKPQDLNSFSKQFQNFADHTAEYIDKRMSYGSIFQEALPLSSIMLDKNLKVTWANKQFCESWELAEEEINKDYLSWDYLSKLTNIGDNDPVLEALKHNVAGIYQIQMRATEESEVNPYEMFVSPVKYNNETKIMLFFYPLMSLQETITDQAKSIVNPVEKTLNQIVKGEFNESSKEQLLKEFEIAGISPMFEKFETMVEHFNEERKNLVDQIEMLYSKLDNYADTTDAIEKSNFGIAQSTRGQVKDLKEFKTNVIDMSMYGKQSEALAIHELSSLKKAVAAFSSNFGKVTELKDIVDEMSISMPKFAKLKEDIKTQKNLLSDTKMRLSHSLAQMIHVKKKITDHAIVERFNNSYERVNSEFQKLDTISGDLDKKLVHLEVMLSKGQMIINDINLKMDRFDIKSEEHILTASMTDLKEFSTRLDSLEGRLGTSEDNVVDKLKSMYMNTKSNMLHSKEIASFMEERPSLIESSDVQAQPVENYGNEAQV
jgi:hypothetical protein